MKILVGQNGIDYALHFNSAKKFDLEIQNYSERGESAPLGSKLFSLRGGGGERER